MRLGPAYEHHVGTPNFMSPEAINGKYTYRLVARQHFSKQDAAI